MKKYFSKTSKKAKSFLAVLLCALMVLTVFPSNISYAADDDIYDMEVITYQYNDCRGYYFTPKATGKYDTFIMLHGGNGIGNMYKSVLYAMNAWVKAGYFEPMVVILPMVEDFGFGDGVGSAAYYRFLQNHLKFIDNDDKFGTLLQKI